MNLWGICKSFSAFRSSNSAGERNVTALCTSQSSPTESHLYSAEASSPTCQAQSTLKSNPYDVPAAALACRGMKAGSRELMCLTAANTSELHSHSTFHWWQRWEEEMCFFPRLRKALWLFSSTMTPCHIQGGLPMRCASHIPTAQCLSFILKEDLKHFVACTAAGSLNFQRSVPLADLQFKVCLGRIHWPTRSLLVGFFAVMKLGSNNSKLTKKNKKTLKKTSEISRKWQRTLLLLRRLF